MSDLFEPRKHIEFAVTDKPRLLVVVDTEAEFDWDSSPDSDSMSVSSMDSIGLGQEIYDEYAIKPCYAVDYAVSSQERGFKNLARFFKSNQCEVGAHLHPWITPPLEEAMCTRYTFPGNLPAHLEYSKLETLTNSIEDVFGQRPVSFKAGRYGVGPNTAAILEKLGYQIDLSFCPPIDYRHCGGPDYSDSESRPFWFGSRGQLLEIPMTGAFCGLAGLKHKQLYNLGQRYPKLKLQSVFSRMGLVDRLILSPEGFSTEEHIKLTKELLAKGVRTFTWSLHSSSLAPGNTPYVNNEVDLRVFLDSFRKYFDFFFGELGGRATSPSALREELITAGDD
jgi:hypothetical protein